MVNTRKHAYYELTDIVEGSHVFLRDLNGNVSVTNDAEWVVRKLITEGHLQGKERLYYLDSEHEMTELLYNVEQGFIGYKDVSYPPEEKKIPKMTNRLDSIIIGE